MECVIALDQGSSSSRALAVDPEGRVVAKAQFPVRTAYPRSGWVEHDAADLAATAERALDAVLSRLPRKALVLGIGIASQRSTVVLWDRRTGRPACPAPSWQDARAADIVVPLQDRQAEVHQKTGLYLTPFYSAPKIRHLLDHEPKARALAEEGRLLVAPVATYLLWRLTRGEAYCVDPSLAQRTLLFDIAGGRWDEGLLKLFGVPADVLPAVRPSAAELGVARRRGRRIPVLAMMGDQQSASLGQGAGPGTGVLNYGTGAFFLLHTGTEARRVPGLLTTVAWQRQGRACEYFQEGTVHAAGTSFDWLRKNLGLLKDVRRIDALCRSSTQRVWMLNALGGLGAPRWDYKTPTAVLGLGPRARPADLVRAVTEGIAFMIADIVGAARAAGFTPEVLRASGGLSSIDYLLAFQADLLQSPIARVRQTEATAMGAASLAAEQAGASWAGVLRLPTVDREFAPALKPEEAGGLMRAWQTFVAAQQKLGAEMRALGAL